MARPKTITQVADVLAGATVSLLEGIQGRFIVGPAAILISLNRGAVGLNTEVTVGSEQVMPSGPVNVNATADELPSIRDDTIITTGGTGGEEIIIRAQNTSGATIQSRAVVRIIEIGDVEMMQFLASKGLIPQMSGS